MKIKVRRVKGATVDVDVANNSSIRELMDWIATNLNIPPQNQKILYRGAVISESTTIESLGISEGGILTLFEKATPNFRQRFEMDLKRILINIFPREKHSSIVLAVQMEIDKRIASLNFDDIERWMVSFKGKKKD